MIKLIFTAVLAGASLLLWGLGLSNGGQNFALILLNLFCVSPLMWFMFGRLFSSGTLHFQKPIVINRN